MDLSKYTAFFRSLRLRSASDGEGPGQTKVVPGSEELSTYLAQFSRDIQGQVTNIEKQTNSNATSQPAAPPQISGFRMTNGPSGEIQFEIDDQGEVNRGIQYGVDLDTTETFSNPLAFELGQSRTGHVLLPGQTFFGRATSWYPGSPISPHVYHGGQAQPKPITGGVIGVRSASQGSGTGAPGTGVGPGPVPARNATAGYDWKLQKATSNPAKQGGFQGPGTPAGAGASASAPGSGSGGAGLTLTEALIANCELVTVAGSANAITGKTVIPYTSLALGFVVRIVATATNTGATTLNLNGIGAKAITKNGTTALSGGELQNGEAYVLMYDGTHFQIVGLMASMVSGDLTIAATGAGTLATVNPDVGSYGDSTHTVTITVNAKGLITSISVNAITFPAPTMAQIIAALGYTPAMSGANATFALTAPVGGGAVTGTITQV